VTASLPKAWIRRHKRDYYYRKAKEEEYRSRAAYKLLQAVNNYGFIKAGDVVVDLGAAPGGWLQAARKIVGERGFVLGVDLRAIQPIEHLNVYTIVADITNPETSKRIKAILPRQANALISDISPNVSGAWELDHARQIDLARQSLGIARSVLVRGGNFFVKVFQGDMLNDFAREVKKRFLTTRLVKPKSSRSESAEMYLLGLDYLEIDDSEEKLTFFIDQMG